MSSEIPETLGQRLKAERERKGLSVQKAADELHLDGWVIEALESGDYARIGPSVYGKGHLKRYAGFLGLPAAEILEAYDARSAAPAPTAQPSLRMRTSDPAAERKLPWAPLVGLAVALGLGGVIWWKPWHPRTPAVPAAGTASTAESPVSAADQRAQPEVVNGESAAADRVAERGTPAGGAAGTAARAVTAGSAAAPAGNSVAVSAASAAPPAPAPAPANSDANAAAGLGRARLRLSFSADSWVDVRDATGRRLFAGYGRANSVRSIAGAAPLKVYLRFASGVQLEVNDRVVAIGPQFVAGEVARFEAGADGVLRAAAHASSVGNPHPRG
jgi:cytoskeleton protein RodZ